MERRDLAGRGAQRRAGTGREPGGRAGGLRATAADGAGRGDDDPGPRWRDPGAALRRAGRTRAAAAAARLLPRRRLGDRRSRDPRWRSAASSPSTAAAGCSRSTTGWRPEHPFPAAGRRRRCRLRLGRTSRPASSAPTRSGSRSAATAPAATSRPASACGARDAGGPQPAMQLLLYPATDVGRRTGLARHLRRRLPADPRGHEVVRGPLPAGRHASPTIRAPR